MKIRKKRIPTQGNTNITSKSHNCLYSYIGNHSQLQRPFKQTCPSWLKGFQSEEQQLINKRTSKTINKISKTFKQQNLDQNKNKIIQTLKYQYRNKANIRKIIKSWKFQNKGYLSVQEFKERFQKNFGIHTTYHQCKQVLKSFTKNKSDKLDTQGFLNMIFYQPKNMILTHKLHNASDQLSNRQNKINNLVDKLQIYCPQKEHKNIINNYKINNLVQQTKKSSKNKKHSIQQDEDSNKDIIKSELNIQQNEEDISKIQKQAYNKYIKHIYSYDRKSEQDCGKYFSKNNFEKFNTTNSPRLTNAQKYSSNNFPLFKQYKTKTRFNATPSHSKLILGQNHMQYTKKKPFQLIQNEKNILNKRYEAKLNKIRKYKNIEQENINRIQQKKSSIDKQNLNRIKSDQQAYNYAAFIQNKWL